MKIYKEIKMGFNSVLPWDFYTYQAKAHEFANYNDKEIKGFDGELKEV